MDDALIRPDFATLSSISNFSHPLGITINFLLSKMEVMEQDALAHKSQTEALHAQVQSLKTVVSTNEERIISLEGEMTSMLGLVGIQSDEEGDQDVMGHVKAPASPQGLPVVVEREEESTSPQENVPQINTLPVQDIPSSPTLSSSRRSSSKREATPRGMLLEKLQADREHLNALVKENHQRLLVLEERWKAMVLQDDDSSTKEASPRKSRRPSFQSMFAADERVLAATQKTESQPTTTHNCQPTLERHAKWITELAGAVDSIRDRMGKAGLEDAAEAVRQAEALRKRVSDLAHANAVNAKLVQEHAKRLQKVEERPCEAQWMLLRKALDDLATSPDNKTEENVEEEEEDMKVSVSQQTDELLMLKEELQRLEMNKADQTTLEAVEENLLRILYDEIDEGDVTAGRRHYRCLSCNSLRRQLTGPRTDKYVIETSMGKRSYLYGDDGQVYKGRQLSPDAIRTVPAHFPPGSPGPTALHSPQRPMTAPAAGKGRIHGRPTTAPGRTPENTRFVLHSPQ